MPTADQPMATGYILITSDGILRFWIDLEASGLQC